MSFTFALLSSPPTPRAPPKTKTNLAQLTCNQSTSCPCTHAWPAVQSKFSLVYEYPAYSVSESDMSRASRRQQGHGFLAERALRSSVSKAYPFAVRTHCEVTSSHGSSSMASVCAGTLSLLDAGRGILTGQDWVCGLF